MTKASEDRLRLERLLPAPIERVFAAWTTGASMARWMSPVGHAEVEVDLRVSGRFRVVMVGGDTRIEHTGKYLEVDPPRRLSFTWESPYTGPEPSVVTVTFTEDGDKTRLVLVHERLPDDQVAAHAGGWGAMVDHLELLLQVPKEPRL
jgi:uncharacterized protein YndB with AHSA1/START domain